MCNTQTHTHISAESRDSTQGSQHSLHARANTIDPLYNVATDTQTRYHKAMGPLYTLQWELGALARAQLGMAYIEQYENTRG